MSGPGAAIPSGDRPTVPSGEGPVNYEVLFEMASLSWQRDPWLALGAVLLLLALAALWWAQRRGKPLLLPRFFVIAAFVVVAATSLALWDHQRLVKALEGGQALVVEGLVQSHSVKESASYNGNSKRYDRRMWESFYVGPVAFGFDRYAPGPGFANSDEEVELDDGDVLRVHYVEDSPGDFASRRIVRLERQRMKHDAAALQRD